MSLNVAVTGYSGTGSSAVIDYLKEKNDFKIALSDNYEHVVLYYPNAVFDLFDKLINNNDPLRSDEAIKEFNKVMKYLNENNFGWFGSYRDLKGGEFQQIVNEFLSKVIEGEIKDTFWYYNYKKVKFSLVKCFVQLGAKFLLKRKIYKWGRSYVIDKNTIEYSFIDEKDFKVEIRKFINSYLEMCRDNEKDSYIFDHLVWPSHANRMDLFDDSFRVIILHRDPRDLFFINKYYWCSSKVKTPGTYPLDVYEFCRYFKGLKKNLEPNSNNVLNLNFEDLVYYYDETSKTIDKFLNVENTNENKFKFFDPKKSIANTQSFVGKKEYEKELSVIEEELKDYLYDFPFTNETAINKMFL